MGVARTANGSPSAGRLTADQIVSPAGPDVPFPPQEALLVERIPMGPNIWYEPKWDGFRGVLENDGGTLGLWSRNGRPLLRYFPELRPLGERMPPHSALDGEIVIEQDERLEVLGLDGIVAKRTDMKYMPGSREAVQKVKHHRTIDCVIVGYRTSGTKIASLLLGLYRKDGTLDFVGHTSGIGAELEPQLQQLLPPLLEEQGTFAKQFAGEIMGRIPGGTSRWSQGRDLPWHEVRPEIVCEIRFDKLEGERFRHGTRFIRFRPDKDPKQCTWDQLDTTRRKGDPQLADLVRANPAE